MTTIALSAPAHMIGDEPIETLYRRYSKQIYNYLLRLVRRGDIAEELLQDVFVAALEGADRFRGNSAASTWLFRIAHHKAVDWLRKKRPHRLEHVEWLIAGDNTERAAFDVWTAEQVRSALDVLSADHRAVIELVFWQGLPYREVARIVGCPVGTVKSRMSYAKRHLRWALNMRGVR
jgi:RNA polymerase sigma-70 factor (ECF subfamily)